MKISYILCLVACNRFGYTPQHPVTVLTEIKHGFFGGFFCLASLRCSAHKLSGFSYTLIYHKILSVIISLATRFFVWWVSKHLNNVTSVSHFQWDTATGLGKQFMLPKSNKSLLLKRQKKICCMSLNSKHGQYQASTMRVCPLNHLSCWLIMSLTLLLAISLGDIIMVLNIMYTELYNSVSLSENINKQYL